MCEKFGRLFLSFLILLFSLHAARAQNPATDDEPVRVETNFVTVPVSVLDKDGRFIAGLKREDFRLAENGVEQEIAFFNDAEAPFTVALVFDISESAKDDFKDIQKSAVAFLDSLGAQDKVVLVAFNKYVYHLSEPTGDKVFLKKQIGEMQKGGATSLYDALEFTIEKLENIKGRKAIVLFTDGVDTTSRATFESSVKRAAELDALVYAVRYETLDTVIRDAVSKVPAAEPIRIVTAKGESQKTAYARATLYLKTLSGNSGGRYLLADSPKNLAKTFDQIAEELRHQYSIGYYPKEDSANGKRTRKIKVSVVERDGAPKAAVRARKSYAYKGAGESENE